LFVEQRATWKARVLEQRRWQKNKWWQAHMKGANNAAAGDGVEGKVQRWNEKTARARLA